MFSDIGHGNGIPQLVVSTTDKIIQATKKFAQLENSNIAKSEPFNFKKMYKKQDRLIESKKILEKYPDRIPVICQKTTSNTNSIPDLDKHKYLVPSDLTAGQLIYVIRKRLNLKENKAIFLFINNVLPPTSYSLEYLYELYKDDDGFLYITYSGENTFG